MNSSSSETVTESLLSSLFSSSSTDYLLEFDFLFLPSFPFLISFFGFEIDYLPARANFVNGCMLNLNFGFLAFGLSTNINKNKRIFTLLTVLIKFKKNLHINYSPLFLKYDFDIPLISSYSLYSGSQVLSSDG